MRPQVNILWLSQMVQSVPLTMKQMTLADSMQSYRKMVCPFMVWLNQFWWLQIHLPLLPVHVQPHTINAPQWTTTSSLPMEIYCNINNNCSINNSSFIINEHQPAPLNTSQMATTNSCHTIQSLMVTMATANSSNCTLVHTHTHWDHLNADTRNFIFVFLNYPASFPHFPSLPPRPILPPNFAFLFGNQINFDFFWIRRKQNHQKSNNATIHQVIF